MRRQSFLANAPIVVLLCLIGFTTTYAEDADGGTGYTRQQLENEAHTNFKNVKDGKNADYIRILTTVPSELFGVAVALRDGTTFTAGDADYAFAIESVSKPFTAASLDLNPQKTRILVQLLRLNDITDINRVQQEILMR